MDSKNPNVPDLKYSYSVAQTLATFQQRYKVKQAFRECDQCRTRRQASLPYNIVVT